MPNEEYMLARVRKMEIEMAEQKYGARLEKSEQETGE